MSQSVLLRLSQKSFSMCDCQYGGMIMAISLDIPANPVMVICSGGSASGSGGGGLATLFDMVLGGLVGTSPHMISASVMALARLLHQFSTQLGGVAPTLLPAVLMLLRTKSREVVKSVLGFVKVRCCACLHVPSGWCAVEEMASCEEPLHGRDAACGWRERVPLMFCCCELPQDGFTGIVLRRRTCQYSSGFKFGVVRYVQCGCRWMCWSSTWCRFLRDCCCGVKTPRTSSA